MARVMMDNPEVSYPQMADYCQRDHTTVLYHARCHAMRMQMDQDYRDAFHALSTEFSPKKDSDT